MLTLSTTQRLVIKPRKVRIAMDTHIVFLSLLLHQCQRNLSKSKVYRTLEVIHQVSKANCAYELKPIRLLELIGKYTGLTMHMKEEEQDDILER